MGKKREKPSTPEEIEKVRLYRKNYRSQHHVQEKMRNDDLLKKYGITLKDYESLLESQNGGCAICGRKTTGVRNQKWFHVDHVEEDHGPRVRGILCKNCNTAIGLLEHTPEIAMAAARYLLRDEEIKDES